MDIYFSDYFEVDPASVEKYGAFNVSLVADLPLFIDPFLLFNSKKTRYRDLHNRIIEYLQFLRDKSVSTEGLSEGLLRSWYKFPEVKQNWLGFTVNGNRGSGLGRDFAVALHTNLHKLFADFGSEKVTHGSHLEKLCLVGDRVGKDNISDFTTNLILEHLLEYTQAFAAKHIAKKKRRVFTVDRVRFNRETETWERGQFELPYFEGDFVLLTPRDLLTKDDTWINKTDLVDEFTSLPAAIPNQQLRDLINNYFRKMLPKKATHKQEREAAVSTIRQFPELVDYYIKLKEERGDEAVSISSEKVRLSRQLYVQQFKELPDLLSKLTAFYSLSGNTYEEALRRVQYLKDVIENKGGHKIFYMKGNPVQREEDVHILYRMTWFATPSDVSQEVNDGRGPADFKISRGSADKSLVEFKLAKNTRLRDNLQKQTKIYEKASDARRSIKVILFFTPAERKRTEKILKELGLEKDGSVIMIDARKDNKPSGSKA
jgi:hypothetical protein